MPAAERALPRRPSLEQQRRQARELLRAFLSDQPDAVRRVRDQLPDKPRITLTDAQYVLAREYGFRSWADFATAIRRAGDTADPARGSRSFRALVNAGDAAALRTFLERQPQVRSFIDAPLFAFDAPALVHAAAGGDPALVDVLLDFGADPNRRSDWWAGGFHPLHRATGAVAERLLAGGSVPDACGAANLDRADLLATLLDADPGRVHERGGDGQTPLHFARSVAVADLLLARDADPDARDVDHRSTPAEWMLGGGPDAERYPLARHLVERGAGADVFLAAALGLTDRLQTLLEASPEAVMLRTGHGAYGEQPPSSFHIYTWTIGGDATPLRAAARFRQDAAAAVLIREVARSDAAVATELRDAAAHGELPLLRALLSARPDAARLDAAGGRTALHAAAGAGQADACRLLIEHGADPDARDESDNAAPMHYAAEYGHLDAVRVLAAAGADIDGDGDAHQLGALGWATCLGSARHEVAEFLLARGARLGIFPAIALGRADDVRRLLRDDPALLDARMNDGDMDLRTPLHHAVAYGDPAIVALLLEHGADPNAQNATGARPASYVRAGPHRSAILELLLRHGAAPDDLLTLLLLGRFDAADDLLRERPADLHAPASQPTPLHHAVARQDADAVRWLIDRGADLDAVRTVGSCGVTPLHVAAAENAPAMVRLLLESGADATVRDTRWNADPLGWADYFGAAEARAVLLGDVDARRDP